MDVMPCVCYTEKATEARHLPRRQYNACNNREKQCACRPTETKPNSATRPRRGHNNPTNCAWGLGLGFVWVHVESFLHIVASPFHSFVTSRDVLADGGLRWHAES